MRHHPSTGHAACVRLLIPEQSAILTMVCVLALQSPGALADSTNADHLQITQQLKADSVSDYKSATSQLVFTRHRVVDRQNEESLGPGWRHSFQTNLYINNHDLLVVDPKGRKIRFETAPVTAPINKTPQSREPEISSAKAMPVPILYVNTSEGIIYRRENRSVWHKTDGERMYFTGSYLTDIVSEHGKHIRLSYARRKLQHVVNRHNEALNFKYNSELLSSVDLPNGKKLNYHYSNDGNLQHVQLPDSTLRPITATPTNIGNGKSQCKPTDEASRLCDTKASPLHVNIPVMATVPDATLLDARPASCKSYFEVHAGTDRGMAIENGFEQHSYFSLYNNTVRSFPIADFFDSESVRVIRTRDLTLPTYNKQNNADALLNRLLKDGDEIQKKLLDRLNNEPVTVKELGQVTSLDKSNVRQVVLDLVIQRGMASASHIAQITAARMQLKQRFGVELHVIEIP